MDLSECLQYPDFSVVVLYKKVVVGFGFMVPDVKYSEAYISFLLVHPEWRRAGIGTFMIYHLIQVTPQRVFVAAVAANSHQRANSLCLLINLLFVSKKGVKHFNLCCIKAPWLSDCAADRLLTMSDAVFIFIK